jgi:EmrB/QacA subfamily drug resistance transporter
MSPVETTPVVAASHRHRWWILTTLCLSVLLVAIDNTIANVALPTLNRQLGATTSQLQWVVDTYIVFFGCLLLFFGHLGDRFGRKRVLQTGLVLFAAASYWAAQAGSVNELIAARAAMGIAVALIYPGTLATLPAVFTNRQERAIAVGIWAGVSGVAVALGPVVGGALLEHFWWGSVFMVNLPVVAVTFVLGAFLLPETRDPAPGRFDGLGGLLSIALVGLLVWTIIEAPSHGWAGQRSIAGFAGSAVLLVAFCWWEARRTTPMLDIRFFRNPRFSAGTVAIAIAYFSFAGFIFVITLYFQLIRGYGTLKAGVATLPFAVVMGILSPLAIVIMKRTGTKVVVTVGLLLMMCGFGVVAVAPVDADYWRVVVVSMCLMAAGMALSIGPATDAILAALPGAKAGVGSAVNAATREVGAALGVAVIGSVLSWSFSSRLAVLWGPLGVSPELVKAGQESVGSALAVGSQVSPSAQAIAAARTSFMDGLHAASIVAAAAALLAAIIAVVFLPQRDSSSARPEEQLAPSRDLVKMG